VTHSFISDEIVARNPNIKVENLVEPLLVKLANSKTVELTNYAVITNLKIFDGKSYCRIPRLVAIILPHLSYDIIIGYPDIFANNLLAWFSHLFTPDDPRGLNTTQATTLFKHETIDDYTTRVSPIYDLNMLTVTSSPVYLRTVSQFQSMPIRLHHPWHKPYHLSEQSPALVNAINTTIDRNGHREQNPPLQHSFQAPQTVHRSLLLDGEPDDDTIVDRSRHDTWNEYFNQVRSADPAQPQPESQQLTTAQIMEMLHIEGSQTFRESLEQLVSKYTHVFTTTVRRDPALLPPLKIEVDQEKWENLPHEKYARPQSPDKQAAIKAFIEQALKDGLIQKSEARQFSQVLLTRKPNGKWRFCVDYRRLNLLTKALGWPLQNIESLLLRIGRKRGKFFATLDLTSGFHQTSISLDSR
jgi:hypothetical protein